MARRNDHTRDELHALALQAAERLVVESGFSQLSARKIAAEIGYSVGTLYHVFRNLDDLILQVNARTLEAMVKSMEMSIQGCGDRKKCIQILAREYFDFARGNKSRWAMLFEHHLPDDQPLPDWYLAQIHRGFILVEQSLAPLVTSARSQEDIHKASRVIWGSVHGICILALSGKLAATASGDVYDMLEMLVENFMAGFVTGEG